MVKAYNSRDRSLEVGTDSTLILEANAKRSWVVFTLKGATDVELQLGAAAATDKGIYLKAGGGAILLDMKATPWYGEVYGIASIAASQLNVLEVEEAP